MTSLRSELASIVAELTGLPFALVGGLAVSARVEPRFTRDIDLAVAVANDEEAEQIVARLRREGYETVALVEQEATGRLATVRLQRGEDAPTVDLLFASSSIEAEAVADAELLTVLGDQSVPVARVPNLLALKLRAEDPVDRPQDRMDAVSLAKVALPEDFDRASELLSLITERGANRGCDLEKRLQALRRETEP